MKDIKLTGIRCVPYVNGSCHWEMFELVLEKIRIKQKFHGKARILRRETKTIDFWQNFISKGYHKKFLPLKKFIEQRDLRFSAKLYRQFENLYNDYHPSVCKIWIADGHGPEAVYDFHYDSKIDNIRKKNVSATEILS